MKKLLFALLLLPIVGMADEIHISDLSSGMYSYQDANKIPDTAAHSLKNVYTDIQGMVQQRSGYATFKTGTANFAITGMWRFTDPTGVEWLLWFSSKTVQGYNGSATSTVFQFTGSAVPSCTDNLGKFWCTNGADNLAWWDGVSSATVSSAPHGQLIAAWRQRIAIANFPGSQSTIEFSADGDGTNWTLGINPTDPFTRSIGGANSGYPINCMRGSYYDNMIVGRKYDIWYGAGFDGSDLGFRNISNEVGCLDSHTMQEFDGSLIFLSWRGIEQMTGSQIQPISEPIRDLVDPIVKNAATSRAATITSQADFAAGSFTNSILVDTISAPGSIKFNWPEEFSVLRDGSSGTKNIWTFDNAADAGTASAGITSGDLVITSQGFGNHGINGQGIRTSSASFVDLSPGTSFQFKIDQITGNSVGGDSCQFIIAFTTYAISVNTPDTGNYTSRINNAAVLQFVLAANNTTTVTTTAFPSVNTPVTVSSTTAWPCTFQFWIGVGAFSYGFNGVTVQSAFNIAPTNQTFMYLIYVNNKSGGGTVKLDYMRVAPMTTSFTSAAQTIGTAITAWGPLGVTEFDNGGSVLDAFASSSSSTTFTNWTTVANGAIPSVSTNSFAKVISTITATNLTDTPQVDDITIRWTEGSAPPFASAVYDRRYWLSYSENLALTPAANDNTLIYQRNHTWTKFTFGAASFGLWKNNLYFGDSTTGSNVYLFDTGTTDNNVAINAEIETKSFDLGFPAHEKALRNMWISYFGGTQGAITASANTDRTGYTSLGTANLSEGIGSVLAKFPFPLTNGSPERGREIQIKLSKNVIGDKLKLYDVVLELYPKEAR